MDAKYILKGVEDFAKRVKPTIMMWNRLEARPRTDSFDRALKAEIRDPLWMLTKQWQLGEYNGEDAGSPVFAKVHASASKLNRYNTHDQQNAYEENIPLEAKVEQKKIPFSRREKAINIDIRLEIGRYWLKLIKSEPVLPFQELKEKFIEKYAFTLPEKSKETDYIYAHRDVWQQYAAISGRSMDGYRLLEDIERFKTAHGPNESIFDGISSHENEVIILDALGSKLEKCFGAIYLQPKHKEADAWLPDRLEYQFSCTAKSEDGEKIIKAEEYYHGHLDWYAFNIQENNSIPGEQKKQTFKGSFIPSNIEFEGALTNRWWKFQDRETDLGDINPSTTDLSKLLLMEFGLTFANDWFLIPYTLPIGSLTNIDGLTIKNNFGETLWIKAMEDSKEGNLPWSMFKLQSDRQNNTLFLAPSAIKIHEGAPIEEVNFVRDEMSNMVWGIESVVQTPFGIGDKGNEVALRTNRYHKEMILKRDQTAVFNEAKISYLAMTEVPEHWIPFMPARKKNDSREIQLQRSAMLRVIEGDKENPDKIEPQTNILREGLDSGLETAYFIHEEEIPRSGITVSQSFQRTRWTNGEVFVWLGTKKKTGRGEGSSNLAFDQIREIE